MLSQLEPLLPQDILSSILSLPPARDSLALSSISRATRTASLPSCFTNSFISANKGQSTAHIALQSATPLFRNTIKKIHVGAWTSGAPWHSSIFDALRLMPNMHSLTISQRAALPLSQLKSLLDVVRHAPLQTLDLAIGTNREIQLSGLETLSIKWGRYQCARHGPNLKWKLNPCDVLWELIRPSIGTFHDLKLTFEVDDGCAGFDLELLKPADLRVFSYEAPRVTRMDIIARLPTLFPHLKDISLSWNMLKGQPAFKESHIASFAEFPDLMHLALCLDLEKEDPMQYSGDMAWYNRSLHRRLRVSEQLAGRCPALEQINWVQVGIDSVGNQMQHRFVVEETLSDRVVKAVYDWWMTDTYKSERRGPLPDNIFKEKNAWFY